MAKRKRATQTKPKAKGPSYAKAVYGDLFGGAIENPDIVGLGQSIAEKVEPAASALYGMMPNMGDVGSGLMSAAQTVQKYSNADPGAELSALYGRAKKLTNRVTDAIGTGMSRAGDEIYNQIPSFSVPTREQIKRFLTLPRQRMPGDPDSGRIGPDDFR